MNLKICIAALLLTAGVCSFAEESTIVEGSIQAGIGISFVGNEDGKIFVSGPIAPAAKIKLYLFPFTGNETIPNVGVGLGAAIHYVTTNDPTLGWTWLYDDQKGDIMYVPLFVCFKLRLPEAQSVTPYITMQHGYSLFFPSENIRKPNDRPFTNDYWGGYCFNVGFGVEFLQNISIEAGYDMIMSGLSTDYRWSGIWTYWEDNLTTHLLTVSLVYSF